MSIATAKATLPSPSATCSAFNCCRNSNVFTRSGLYRPVAGESDAYPGLRPVLSLPIDWDLIRRQYNEMVKFATALRLGTAAAADILRRFTRANLQHPTYRALIELGKALRTTFLCRYLRTGWNCGARYMRA